MLANEKSKGMGDQEEGMDLADEVDMGGRVKGILHGRPAISHAVSASA